MTVKEILAHLKSMSNETMIAHNKKRGAGDNQFGVKMGDIRTIAGKIKSDHELALQLWETKNIDARQLAMLIIKPKDLSAKDLQVMVKSIDYYHTADWFNSYILKEHPERETVREKWMDSDNKWLARSGWSLTAGRVTRAAEGLDIPKLLDRIEAEMPTAPSEVQWTMNTTLAQIGINFPKLRKRALDIGERLGIYRDYPVSKGCTSPFAPIWINEMVKRQTTEK
jgi:3-methyladenine DNA glycosylase AlkD